MIVIVFEMREVKAIGKKIIVISTAETSEYEREEHFYNKIEVSGNKL